MNTNEKAKYGVRKVAKITLEFPEPPVGGRWHNPEGLSAEQVGEGFRLATSEEAAILNKKNRQELQVLKVQVLYSAHSVYEYWGSCDYVCMNFTYRVPAETPIIKAASPMKFSEIPVGQVFRWSFSKDKSTAERGTFMKINSSQKNSFGEAVNCVALNGCSKGCVTFFRDEDEIFFFESSFDGEIGELLMVQE